ncbi:MAG TPA: DUF6448 family protein [Syntrophorhabdus sp.]|nr:DUF6448 family protein [Syntrophorhabdus sp.]
MNTSRIAVSILVAGVLIITSLTMWAGTASAHCDTMDGPVVKAAQKALDSGNVNLVLVWVQKKDEAEIKSAFQKALAVRKLGPQAKDLADMYFFETLVRIHRAGEGAPYMGIKPAGTDMGPAVIGADKALETSSIDPLVKLVQGKVTQGIHEHFEKAMKLKKNAGKSVEAGREYVEAYVTYVHYVDGIYGAASGKAGHGEGGEISAHHEE